MTSLLTEGLVARGHDVTLFATGDSTTQREAARDLSARLLARREHVAVGAVRDAEPRRGGRARGRVRHHPLRGGVLPDVAGVRAAVADADRPDAAPLAERRGGRAVVALSGGAVRRHLQRAGAPAAAASTSSAPCCTASTPTASRSATQPDDYLLFLGRFTEGKGVLQAIEIAKRAGMRLILAAAEDDYYREHVAPHVDGRHIVYFGEADFAAKVKLYGGARALLYPIQAREPFGLVLAEAMACGTPVAALDRGAVREVVDDGVTGMVFDDLEQMVNGLPRVFGLDRRRVRERAVARFGVDAHGRRVRRRLRAARGGASCPTLTPRRIRRAAAGRPDRPRHLRAPRRRVARVRRDARAARRRRRPRRRALRVARRGRVGQRPVARARRRPRRRPRRASCARPRRSSASPKSSCSITRTAICAGPTCPSCTRRSSRCSSATGPTRSSRSARTGSTGTSITSASTSAPIPRCCRSAPPRRRSTTSRCREGIMREVVEAAHAKGRRAARIELLGHRARRVRPRREAADVRRRRPRLGAAQARRAALPPDADGPGNPIAWIDDDEAQAVARHASTSAASPLDADRRADARAPRRTRNMLIETLDSCAARTAAAG